MASVKSLIAGYVPDNWHITKRADDGVFGRWNNEDVKGIANNRFIRDVLGSNKSRNNVHVKLPPLNNVVEKNIQSKPTTSINDKKRTGGNCSLMCCYHSWIKRDETPIRVILDRKLKEVSLLQTRVKIAEKNIAEQQQRYSSLAEENAALMKEIEDLEKEVHGNVRKLLQKYQMFRGAISSIQSKFDEDKTAAQSRFLTAKQKAHKEVSDLQSRLHDLELILEKKNAHLRTLLTYKDRDYPVKAMRIAELKHQIDGLEQDQGTELETLRGLIGVESKKLYSDEEHATDNILGVITDRIIDSMPKGIKELALQNITMKRELRLQKDEEKKVVEEIKELKEEIKRLGVDPQTNVPLHVFPHFLLHEDRLEDEIETKINIPRKEELLL